MAVLSEALLLILLLASGIFLAKRTTRMSSIHLDIFLIFSVIISAWLGRDVFLLKIFDFELILSSFLQAVLLGIVIGRVFLLKRVKLKA